MVLRKENEMRLANVRYIRRSLLVLCAALAVAATMLTRAPAAMADTSMDGTNPQTTGCASSATTIDSFTQGVFGWRVELRFSSGCETAWTRLTCVNQRGCFGGETYSITRDSISCDGSASLKVIPADTPNYGTVYYTNQLYDGPCDISHASDDNTGEHTISY
jgi:hypothetical protein